MKKMSTIVKKKRDEIAVRALMEIIRKSPVIIESENGATHQETVNGAIRYTNLMVKALYAE